MVLCDLIVQIDKELLLCQVCLMGCIARYNDVFKDKY
jgi:hypothetical protein